MLLFGRDMPAHAFDIRAGFDRQAMMKYIAGNLGRFTQFHNAPGDLSVDRSIDAHHVAGYRTIDNRVRTDGDRICLNVAIHDSFELNIATGFQSSIDSKVLAED